MASNYDKARKFLRDNTVWGLDRELAAAGIYASLAVADEVRLLRQELAAGVPIKPTDLAKLTHRG